MFTEEEGRDLSCVVSSLAQLMMDPYFRSVPGFQCLLQKEWVAMGHPFTSRHRLVLPTAEGTTEPVEVSCSVGIRELGTGSVILLSPLPGTFISAISRLCVAAVCPVSVCL